ncbi:MAG: flippase-like domain-containing protein [Anaerolineales bacterium]|nr:flippase-like domain-containing protein [Anaerolineales bacterium]
MRKAAQILLGLAISLLALALAFRGADTALVAAALRGANYLYLVPGIGLIWLGLYLRALSWRAILGHQVTYRRVYDAMNEGYLLNNLLPFRLGEFGRAYLISRGSSIPAYQALSSVVVERVIDLIMAVVLLLAFLPYVIGLDLARSAALSSVLLGVAALAGLVVTARQQARVVRLARAVLERLPGLHAQRWAARLEAALAGLSVFQDPRRALAAGGWSFLAWVAAGLGAWFTLLAFLPGATPVMGFVVLTVVALAAAVPSLPGSAGVFELTIVTVLAVFGIDNNRALSFGLIFHAQQIVLTMILGGLALAREGETLAHLARSARAFVRPARPNGSALAPKPLSSDQ